MTGPKKNKRPGFTLIELMVVLSIAALLTPMVFRLHHEGVKKGDDQAKYSSTSLRRARTLFQIIKQDLDHAQELVAQAGSYKTGPDCLVARTLSISERARLLAAPGDLTSNGPDPSQYIIVVYRLTDKGELIRQEMASAEGEAGSPMLLADHLADLNFEYTHMPESEADLVRLSLARRVGPGDKRYQPQTFSRTFKVGP